MANFSALKTTIQNAIRTNGNNEITGQLLQDILLSMVVVLGDEAITNVADDLSTETSQRQNADGTLQGNINAEATARATADAALQNAINTINSNISNGYVYAGIATPSATPVTGKVFYIATTAGTYTNFGGLTVTKGINILKYNGSTWSQEQIIGIDDYPTAGSSGLALSGGIDAEIKSLVGYYTCGTAAATAAKTITASAYVLLQGGSIKVKFTYKNTAADATLKIGSADAKPLFYGGRRAGSSNSWDAGEVVEIFYDGTNYMANNVMGGGAGDGAFDISVYNAVDGTPTPYTDLADALGTNGANIPEPLRKGGMSVKFIQGTVQSTDNKYVQYLYTGTSTAVADFTNTGNWEKTNLASELKECQDVLNVNEAFNHPSAYTGSKTSAYAAIISESGLRKIGLIITYLYNSGATGENDHWIIEQFVGSSTSQWGDVTKWKGIDVEVEQNTYTDALKSIPDWVANHAYIVGNQVKSGGKYYYCSTATSGDAEFPSAKFTEISTFSPRGTKLGTIKIADNNYYILSNLIHIKGFGGFELAPNVGDVFYHTSSHRLLIREDMQGVFSTIPYFDGMVIECDGNLYRWNGSDVVLANSLKFNTSDIDTALNNPNSNTKVLSEKSINDLVIAPFDSIQHENLLYSSYLEQGTIDDYGNDGASTVRVRFSHKIGVPFAIKVNDGYGIIKAYLYNKQTGSLSDTIGMTGRDYSYFKSDGIYDVRLLIRNTNSWSEPISPTEDIIDYIIPYEKEKSEELLGIGYATLLEGGDINYVTGENVTGNAAVRFVNKLTRPFTIELTSDYVIQQISLYDRFTGDFISSSYAASGTRTYTSNGEYGVRLVVIGSNGALIVPEAAGSVIKSFGDAVDDISSSLYTETATYCTINDMPDAARKKFAILTTTPNGPVWSDKSVWRFMKDNLLAVTAKSYAVMSLDNDTIINEHSKDEVHTLYSATKLMTAVITCQYINDLTASVTVIQGDIPVGEEDNERVNVGDVITYEGLLKNMIIPSDNVAPSVLSRCVGYIINPSAASDADARNAFYTAMQQKATALGMSNTTYPGAISTGQSSAADICKLLKYIYNNESDITALWGLLAASVTITGTNARTYTVSSTTTEFARTLIPEFVGGKTGTGGQGDNAEGVYAIIFQSAKDSKYYALCLMACKPANNQRFIDTRHIIDESYEA